MKRLDIIRPTTKSKAIAFAISENSYFLVKDMLRIEQALATVRLDFSV
ncbi:MAG: hypothetical protein ACRCZS_15030 [Chroococcidiopsis sp.]|jgi:hypothetical protein